MKEIECVQHTFIYEVKETNNFILKEIMAGVLKMESHYPMSQRIGFKSYNRLEDGREKMKQMMCEKLGVNVRNFSKYYDIVSVEHKKEIVLCTIESDEKINELYVIEHLDEGKRTYTFVGE